MQNYGSKIRSVLFRYSIIEVYFSYCLAEQCAGIIDSFWIGELSHMIALLQRVKSSSVRVNEIEVSSIGRGLLVLLAVQPGDTEQTAHSLLQKLSHYRVFSDADGKMNLSLLDVAGDLMLVPQFTLAADTSKGLRPGFSTAATPAEGKRLFDIMLVEAKKIGIRIGAGQFGADMQVALINDGPATFWLQESATLIK